MTRGLQFERSLPLSTRLAIYPTIMISLTLPPESSAEEAWRREPSRTGHWWLGLAIVVLLGGLYGWLFLDRGWVPHDDGTLAQSAERVLQGELPHRDFDEVYTGGLSYLNAHVFSYLDISLTSIRRVLFFFFLLWLPAVFFIATRWATIPVAALISLLIVTFSIPNYSAAIPSWYNLFFATMGAAALLAFLETRRRRWILLAGLCGGLSILMKIVGLYYVAAVGFALLFWEQSSGDQSGEKSVRSNRALSALLVFGLMVFIAAMFWVYGQSQPNRSIGALVVPAVIPALLVIQRELSKPQAPPFIRLQSWWHLGAPFLLGVLGVLVPFAGYYVANGALSDLIQGLFVDPAKRLQFASADFPSLVTLQTAILPIGLLASSSFLRPRLRWIVAFVLIIPLAMMLAASDLIPIYQFIFYSFRWIVPIAVVAGGIVLYRRERNTGSDPLSARKSAELFTMLAVAGLCNLVQFPFAAPIYFFYAAPLGILALVSVIGYRSSGSRPVFVMLVAFYMIFCAIRVNTGFIYRMGVNFSPDNQIEFLDIDRGGIRVSPEDKAVYESLTTLIRDKARGDFIYAAPDCPQVYFLSGFRNPTPTLFDFFDASEDRVTRTLEALEEHDVSLVVLNRKKQFSDPPPPELLAVLRVDYPESGMIGPFEVRWKP